MKKLKMGPWHPANTPPVHHGVYEVYEADCDGRAFARWDGKSWGATRLERFFEGTVEAAVQRATVGVVGIKSRMKPWRGLAKRPSP